MALLLIAACSQGGGMEASSSTTRSPADHSGDSTAGSTSPPGSTPLRGDEPVAPVEWTTCGSGLDCGSVIVPLDHSQPDGQMIELMLLRRPARDPDARIGSLVVNPGGPGGSGLGLAAALTLPTEVMDRFDIVGFDPRGVGGSTPMYCHSHLPAIYDVDPTMEDQADVDTYRSVSQQFVDECAAKYPEMLPHMGTVAVAHDLDLIRAAIGDEKLTFLGYSYGTSIAQQYARLYPDRVRALVLDGVVDPSMTGLEAVEFQAQGFENALTTYAEDCDRRRCLDSPALEVIDRVIARSEASPIAAPRADRPATPGVLALAMAQALYSKTLWPQLTRALTDADAGNGTAMVRLADSYLRRDPDGTYPNSTEVYFAVSCLDADWPRSFDAVLTEGRRIGDRFPRLGEALVNDYARCPLWPVPPQPLQPVPADIKGLPPIVVVSTTGDPATPYESGVKIAGQIPDARLITNVGEGHTVVGQGNSCIDDLIAAYLVDLTPPEDNTVCD